MPDSDQLPPFPKRIPEKLKAIRDRLGMTPADLAPFVGAKTGAEILAYENDEDDLLVSVLFGYAKLANIRVENLLRDDRDLWLGASRESEVCKDA
jgi:DNA-binding XRE family transcriptional regulator